MKQKGKKAATLLTALLLSATGLSAATTYADKEYKSEYEYSESSSESEQTYETSEENKNVILSRDGSINFFKVTISKSGDGDSKEKDLNAAVLSLNSSKIKISDSEVKTNGENADALFSISDSTIETSDSKVETEGKNSSAIATEDGGTIIVSGGESRTLGSDSPAARVNGDLTLKDDTKIESISSDGIVFSGDGKFKSNRATISVPAGDAFVLDDAEAEINIERTQFLYGKNTDAVKKGNNDKYDVLNVKDSKVVFNSKRNPIFGKIVADKKSTLELNFSERTSFEGSINPENTSKDIKVKLDDKSRIVLSGDSYISELNNEVSDNSNIFANGHKLFVNGEEVSISQEQAFTWDYDFSTETTEPVEEEDGPKDKTNILTLLGAAAFAFMVALISTISISRNYKYEKRNISEKRTIAKANANKMKKPWERK